MTTALDTTIQVVDDISELDDIVGTHGPFVLTTTNVYLTKKDPLFDEWQAATEWCQKAEKGSPFWVGVLLAFGEQRWGDKYAQAVEVSGLAVGTLMNAAYVMKHVPPEQRRASLSFEHHKEVAPLSTDEQTAWLDKAEVDGLTVKELRHQIKVSKAQASGVTVELWVLVKCTDVEDQQKFADKCKLEGRAVELKTREV